MPSTVTHEPVRLVTPSAPPISDSKTTFHTEFMPAWVRWSVRGAGGSVYLTAAYTDERGHGSAIDDRGRPLTPRRLCVHLGDQVCGASPAQCAEMPGCDRDMSSWKAGLRLIGRWADSLHNDEVIRVELQEWYDVYLLERAR